MQCVRWRCCLHLEVLHRSVPKDWREEKGARSQPCGTRETAKEPMRTSTGTAGTRADEHGTRLVASLGWMGTCTFRKERRRITHHSLSTQNRREHHANWKVRVLRKRRWDFIASGKERR